MRLLALARTITHPDMTRLVAWTRLALLIPLLAWFAAIVLLNTSPRWLAESRHGEQAYGVLLIVASMGLRVWPWLIAAAILLATWLWPRLTTARPPR